MGAEEQDSSWKRIADRISGPPNVLLRYPGGVVDGPLAGAAACGEGGAVPRPHSEGNLHGGPVGLPSRSCDAGREKVRVRAS